MRTISTATWKALPLSLIFLSATFLAAQSSPHALDHSQHEQMHHGSMPPNMDMGEGTVEPPHEHGRQGAQQQHLDAGQANESIRRDTGILQEPENELFRTGENLPPPELLNGMGDRKPMSLDDFLAFAQRSNPTLAQARSNVSRSQLQGKQAALMPNPSIGYSGEHIRGGSYGGGEQGGYFEQELVLGGKLGLRRKIYDEQALANQIGVEQQGYRVRNDVEQAFYSTLTSQALVAVHRHLLKIALDAVDTSHQLSNLGQADAPDVLQAEVESEQAKVDYVYAQRVFIRDFQILAAVAGVQHMALAPLMGDLETPPALDTDEQLAKIMDESPSVSRAKQDVAVAEAQWKDSRRESIPNLKIRAGEWYSGELVNNANKAAGPMSFVDASVQFPLWNRNQGNVAASKILVERTQQDVVRTQLALKEAAEPLVQNYLSSKYEAEKYKTQLLPRSKRAYELYLMKYEQMASAYPQVLISQRTLFQLQVGYLRALEDTWKSAIALRNFTLTDGLNSVSSTGSDDTQINAPTR